MTPKKPYHMRKMSNPEQSYAIRSKELNLASIPDSIRTEAILNTSATVGPKTKFRSISTRRMTEMEPLSSHRTKRIEDITTIINRVVRAGCCLKPKNPEQFEVMKKAVGDGSEYF